MRPNVYVIGTGGTIAGVGPGPIRTTGYEPSKIHVSRLMAEIPEINDIASVHAEQLFQISSENLTQEHWIKLAKHVDTLLASDDVDGVVITHGTDTIEETAYFLNLVIKSHKPMVVVGAMRPSSAISRDGPLNLFQAVALAAHPESRGRGVLVLLNEQIHAARDVAKCHTVMVDSFRSPDFGMLGYMHDGRPTFYRFPVRRHTLDSEFSLQDFESLPPVHILVGYADAEPRLVDCLLKAKTAGIVHAGTGNGSVSERMLEALRNARKRGVAVLRGSRVGGGIVLRNGEVDDDAEDFIASDTLNPQKAKILLQLGLVRTRETREIQRMFSMY